MIHSRLEDELEGILRWIFNLSMSGSSRTCYVQTSPNLTKLLNDSPLFSRETLSEIKSLNQTLLRWKKTKSRNCELSKNPSDWYFDRWMNIEFADSASDFHFHGLAFPTTALQISNPFLFNSLSLYCYWLCCIWIYRGWFTNIIAWKSDVGSHNSCWFHFFNLRIVQIFF